MENEQNLLNQPPREVLTTISLLCEECGKEFTMPPAEQKFYNVKGFHLPKRCPECRKKLRDNKVQIVCIDCGITFELDGYEQEYFTKRGYQFPKRCRSCREIKKQRNEAQIATEVNQ